MHGATDQCRHPAASVCCAPRGFTLIELLTVIAILGILTVIAVPTFRGINESGQFSRTSATIASLITTAQIPSYDQPSGLLIMRARERSDEPPGPNSDEDNPALGFQEVRVVVREPFPDSSFNPDDIRASISQQRPYFRIADNTEPQKLSELTWVAPDYAIDADTGSGPRLDDDNFQDERLTDPETKFPAGVGDKRSESLLNAFFVIFERGECITMQPNDPNNSSATDKYNTIYAIANDEDMVFAGSDTDPRYRLDEGALWINHETARGMMLYSRNDLLEQTGSSDKDTAEARWDYLRTKATPLYCGRYGGNMLLGTPAVVED